jgi:hypothetical protein
MCRSYDRPGSHKVPIRGLRVGSSRESANTADGTARQHFASSRAREASKQLRRPWKTTRRSMTSPPQFQQKGARLRLRPRLRPRFRPWSPSSPAPSRPARELAAAASSSSRLPGPLRLPSQQPPWPCRRYLIRSPGLLLVKHMTLRQWWRPSRQSPQASLAFGLPSISSRCRVDLL